MPINTQLLYIRCKERYLTVVRTPEMNEAAARAAVERTRDALAAQPSAADYDRLKAELNMELALLRAINQVRTQSRR